MIVFPSDVDGWLSPAEGHRLAELAQGKSVLELGSWCGRSTICLAQTAGIVHAVDHHHGDSYTGARDTLAEFLANLRRFGVEDKVVLHKGPAEKVLPEMADARYDLVFIDADHGRQPVLEHIALARRLLARGGVWAFHDYANASIPEVGEAVRESLRAPTEVVDSLGIVHPGPPTLSFVVPTSGRLSLAAALGTLAHQTLIPGDEVLVIGDGVYRPAVDVFRQSGLAGRFIAIPGPGNDWGAGARNFAISVASGDYLAYLDDDDGLIEGAVAVIRRSLADRPGRPHLFRMQCGPGGEVLWRYPAVVCGNVSTQMFVHPNCPTRTGRWGSKYGHDYEFIRGTLARWPENAVVWNEAVIATWNAFRDWSP